MTLLPKRPLPTERGPAGFTRRQCLLNPHAMESLPRPKARVARAEEARLSGGRPVLGERIHESSHLLRRPRYATARLLRVDSQAQVACGEPPNPRASPAVHRAP